VGGSRLQRGARIVIYSCAYEHIYVEASLIPRSTVSYACQLPSRMFQQKSPFAGQFVLRRETGPIGARRTPAVASV
jgi:hypothetical protein